MRINRLSSLFADYLSTNTLILIGKKDPTIFQSKMEFNRGPIWQKPRITREICNYSKIAFNCKAVDILWVLNKLEDNSNLKNDFLVVIDICEKGEDNFKVILFHKIHFGDVFDPPPVTHSRGSSQSVNILPVIFGPPFETWFCTCKYCKSLLMGVGWLSILCWHIVNPHSTVEEIKETDWSMFFRYLIDFMIYILCRFLLTLK
jgi:hypothetical protein